MPGTESPPIAFQSGTYNRGLKGFFTRSSPAFDRVLLVESGSRNLYDTLVTGIFETYGNHVKVDLVTCFAGVPDGLKPDARVYRIHDYQGRAGRNRLYSELRAQNYSIIGIICAAEPIMTKWKWALAAHVPAKLFILNENGDWFWVQWSEWRTIRHFLLYRLGLSGARAVPTLARLAVFPFTLLYLILYAAAAHARRALRS